MADLLYAVIALKTGDVASAVAKLEAQNLTDVGAWLTQNQAEFYGSRIEDWRPFNDSTIRELVNETRGYETQTNLIDQLDEEADLEMIRPITVYFIDVFALFLEKYINFARRIDFSIAEKGRCCLLIPSTLPPQMQDLLIGTYCNVWRQVCKTYRGGNLHRIAMRLDDLQNFRNCLIKLFGSEDKPTTVADENLNDRFRYYTKVPPSVARL